MKKRSFIRNLSIMLFMQFVLLTVLFVALIVHMRNSAVTEMETAADNVLAIYRVNLENRIERANNILKNLTLSEETALEMIRSDKIGTTPRSLYIQPCTPLFFRITQLIY